MMTTVLLVGISILVLVLPYFAIHWLFTAYEGEQEPSSERRVTAEELLTER